MGWAQSWARAHHLEARVVKRRRPTLLIVDREEVVDRILVDLPASLDDENLVGVAEVRVVEGLEVAGARLLQDPTLVVAQQVVSGS